MFIQMNEFPQILVNLFPLLFLIKEIDVGLLNKYIS